MKIKHLEVTHDSYYPRSNTAWVVSLEMKVTAPTPQEALNKVIERLTNDE